MKALLMNSEDQGKDFSRHKKKDTPWEFWRCQNEEISNQGNLARND